MTKAVATDSRGAAVPWGPLVFAAVGVACAFAAEELLFYQRFDGLAGSLELFQTGFAIMNVIQAAVSALFLMVLGRLPKREFEKSTFAVGVCCSAVGIAVAAASAFQLVGFLLLCVSSCLLLAFAVKALVGLPPQWCSVALVAAALMHAVLSPVCYLGPAPRMVLIAVFEVVGFAILMQVVQGRPTDEALAIQETSERNPVSLVKIAVGIVVMVACLEFLDVPGSLQNHSTEVSFVFTLTTHVFAAAALALFVFALHDESFSLTLRTVLTVCIASFAVVPVFGSDGIVPSYLNSAAYSLFVYTLLLAITRFTRAYAGNALVPFYGMRLTFCVASLFGAWLGQVDAALAPDGRAYSFVAIVILVSLVIVGLWLLRDKELEDFFWGNQRSKDVESDDVSDGRRMPTALRYAVQGIAREFALTPRETEVCELVALGRSSPFIAEELVLSENTVRKHILHIYRKCQVHSKQELLTLVNGREGLQ